MRLIDVDAFKRQIAGMTIANSYSVNKANALCEPVSYTHLTLPTN